MNQLDIELKEFYIQGITLFIIIKYFISQLLHYLYLDYILIIIYFTKYLSNKAYLILKIASYV